MSITVIIKEEYRPKKRTVLFMSVENNTEFLVAFKVFGIYSETIISRYLLFFIK